MEYIVKNGGSGVSLQPSDWLNLNEFNNKVWENVGKNLYNVTPITDNEKSKSFIGTTIRANISIFDFNQNGGYKLNFLKEEFNLIQKLRAKQSLRSAYPKTTGEFIIPLCGDCGHAKG